MKEYLTEAVVLGFEKNSFQDKIVDFYTKEFGRLKAKVISGQKITSKLSPHLDVLNLVRLRLVQKNQFIVADVLTLDRFLEIRRSFKKTVVFLQLLKAVKMLFYEQEKDSRFWYWLVRTLKRGLVNFKDFLKILGYDPQEGRCEFCDLKEISYFSLIDQSFVCKGCSLNLSDDNLLLIDKSK